MSKTITLPFDTILMEAIKDMVFMVQVEENSVFKYVFFNQAVFKKTHLTSYNLGKSFQESHNLKDAGMLNEHYSRVLKTAASVVFEDTYTTPAGEAYFSETTLTPLSRGSDAGTYIIGVVKDITVERVAGMASAEAWERLKESRSRYRSLYENNTDAIFCLDLNGQILAGNPAVHMLTEYALNDLIGTGFPGHIPKHDEEFLKNYFQLALEGVSQEFPTTFSGKNGKPIPVLVHFAPVEVNEKIVGVYATLKNMTELNKMASQYVESENRFRIIAENAHDVIILMDHQGETIYVSPASKRVYGLEPEEYMGKPPFHNIHPDDIPQMKKTYALAVQEAKTYISEVRLQHKTRGWIWSEVQGTPVFDEHRQFVHMLMISQDITLHKERETQLHHYAYHDSLTGLPNRRFLKEAILKELSQASSNGDVLTVILLDIDYFKEINDHLGHDVGDSVIQEFSRRLLDSIGEDDIAARLGGDEFILLLPDVKTVEQAEMTAQKIQRSVAESWMEQAHSLEVTTSIGIALTPVQGATVTSILKNADIAMYESKKAGRNTYRIHSL